MSGFLRNLLTWLVVTLGWTSLALATWNAGDVIGPFTVDHIAAIGLVSAVPLAVLRLIRFLETTTP